MSFLVLTILVFTASVVVASDNLITYSIPVTAEIKKLSGYPEDSYLNFTEIVTKNGYTNNEHNVTTKDGYILKVFNMKNPNCTAFQTIPVLVLHGLLYDATSFTDMGPNASLGYLLADSCYDVWLLNSRGTTAYSRAHTTLDPDKDAAFWRYGLDEMGLYDLPATIDYMINETSVEIVNLVGFSQGGTETFIALSEKPEYNDKVGIAITIAPAARLKNSQSAIGRPACALQFLLNSLIDTIGFLEWFFKNGILQVLLELLCHDVTFTRPICLGALALFDNYHEGSILDSTLEVAFSHVIVGISWQLLNNYCKVLDADTFTRYDYGSEENLVKYGNVTAPEIDLSKITAPVVMFTGESDKAVVTEDVEWLGERLGNLLEIIVVEDNWNHLDLVYSQFLPTLLYPKLNEYLMKYSN